MLKMYDLAGAEADRRFSPYCWRIKLAAAHKGLAIETVPWRFTEKDVIAFSGQPLVPVLLDGTREIHDSWTIANYFEEKYPDRPSLFGGASGKALSLFHMNWANAFLHLAMMKFVVLDIWKHVDPKDRDYFRESREKRLGKTLEAAVANRDSEIAGFRESLMPLRLTLRAQPFLGGDTPLYADYAVFGAFQWCRCISDYKLLASDDPIYAWRERMLDLYDGLARKVKGYPV
ncbi:MAG TPA: glutathione S-transferase family protein [Stellaceae bacterium]|jgi:glutathione S-transferase|nr:glutathione S-transferase family protein [Stellaceae bacterium]